MTTATVLPAQDWETLRNLAIGTAVAQYGYTDGHDTATIARAANIVFAMMQSADIEPTRGESAYDMWYDQLAVEGLTGRVIGSRAPFPECSMQLVSGTFGLAFIHPPAIREVQLAVVLDEAQRIADTVAVTADELPWNIAMVQRAGVKPGWHCIRTGSLWVLKRYSDDSLRSPGGM